LASTNTTTKKQWLVIGDSISMGYISALRAAAPEYEVVHAPSFVSGSQNNDNVCVRGHVIAVPHALRSSPPPSSRHWHDMCALGWLGASPLRWDVVSINAGAHDLAEPDNEHLDVTTYASLLQSVLGKLSRALKPSAVLLWARITPVPTNPAPECVLIPGRLETSVAEYNSAADAVVARAAAARPATRSCDLHRVITDHCGVGYSACDWAQCKGPHFSDAGFAALGEAMVACAAA